MVSRLHRNNCYTFQNTAAVMISGQMMHVGGQVISSPAVKKPGATHQESRFLGHGPGQPTDSARSIRPVVMLAPPKTLF